MITAIVRFRLTEGTTRDDAKAMFEKSAPNYRGIPGLVRKYYLVWRRSNRRRRLSLE
jgi:hypothetical protein